jgi:hypothetical protein
VLVERDDLGGRVHGMLICADLSLVAYHTLIVPEIHGNDHRLIWTQNCQWLSATNFSLIRAFDFAGTTYLSCCTQLLDSKEMQS